MGVPTTWGRIWVGSPFGNEAGEVCTCGADVVFPVWLAQSYAAGTGLKLTFGFDSQVLIYF